MRWFYRLLPRTAFLRVAVIVALIISFSLALALWFFARNAYAPGIQQYARLTALQAQIAKENQWNEESLVKRISDATDITIESATPISDRHLPYLSEQVVSRFQDELSYLLHESVDVRLEDKRPPVIWVTAPSFRGHWLRVPIDFFRDYDRYLLFAWGVLTPFFAILSGLLIAGGLTRSLRRLKRVAKRVARGEIVAPIRGSSIAEIDAAIRAFNHMTLVLGQAQKDRVLLLSGISHDLRTPLTRLRLAVELLEDDLLSEGMINDIEDMDAILSQFIAFVRDGADEPSKRLDLNALIKDASKNYSLSTKLELGELTPIGLKPVTMRRLLQNLLINAIKYGAAPVEISTREVNGIIELDVRDHGPGIALSDRTRLLQPFARGEVARTTSGSGLGLAIVKRIVDMHHGYVELDNHPDGGLLIRIRLPVDVTAPEQLAQNVR